MLYEKNGEKPKDLQEANGLNDLDDQRIHASTH